jgi:CHAT domain-containing protein
LLACGGPDFDHAAPVLLAQADAARPSADWTPRGAGAVRSTPLSEIEFGELPMAANEAVEIAALWDRRAGRPDALVLTGAQATEESFETHARGRAVLHLATHGFFLATAEPTKSRSTRGVGPGAAAPTPAEFALALETDHSLLSGLAFAGANSRTPSGGEDGVLLAEEICDLDLSGVRLAVLSACDTGLGRIQNGEGVFGLRRAFRIAGVRTLVTSLWPVVDETARARMVDFYGGWLERSESVAAALRSAALRILEDRRARGESTHPFHWAGFLAVGGRD